MAKPSEFTGFKQLLREWNQRLYESGFRDIEDPECGGYSSERPGTQVRYERMDEITREARIQYFRRVQRHVAETNFETELERDILNLYAQGVTQAIIKRVLSIDGHRYRVYAPIHKWLRIWRLK